MSEAISQIVNVTIKAGTASLSRAGFGTPLLLSYHTAWPELVREYTTLAGLAADFPVGTTTYKMGAALFAQNPRPLTVKIGRLPEPPTPHTTEIDVTGVLAGETLELTVTDHLGNALAVSVPFNTDEPTTATDLAAAITALAGVTATAAANVVTVVADTNGPMVFFDNLVGTMSIEDVTLDWGYDAALQAIADVDPDFYAVAVDVNSGVNVLDVAAWVLSNKRIAGFGPQVTDPAVYNAAAATALKAADNDRAFSLVTENSRCQFPEVAMLAEALPFDPGSQTWYYKSLAGVEVDNWTATEQGLIEDECSNLYRRIAGLNVTSCGIMHGGEFIDVVRGLDWLQCRLQEAIFLLLATNRKIPYTDSGVQLILSAMRRVLRLAETRGLIDAGWTVGAPRVADIAQADRAGRCLPDVVFEVRLAGAIKKVLICGTVLV